MGDNINRSAGQSERFKNLCSNLRANGLKKTDAEIIDIAMTLLKKQFITCCKCKHYDEHSMNPERLSRCPDFEEK